MVEMEWYESMLDTMSWTRTPLSVLDRHFTKSENETTSIITSTTTITNGSTVPEIKRRKLNGYSGK
jgi:cyclin D6